MQSDELLIEEQPQCGVQPRDIWCATSCANRCSAAASLGLDKGQHHRLKHGVLTLQIPRLRGLLQNLGHRIVIYECNQRRPPGSLTISAVTKAFTVIASGSCEHHVKVLWEPYGHFRHRSIAAFCVRHSVARARQKAWVGFISLVQVRCTDIPGRQFACLARTRH